MIAVLMDSRKVGASAKIAVRSAQRVRVSGLDADIIRVLLFDEAGACDERMVREDEIFLIPFGISFVQARHVMVGKGRVYVDLLK